DSCDATFGCTNAPNTNGCSDGNACTINDHCEAGICMSGPLRTCDDGNPCTTDGCDPSTACHAEPNELPCNDFDPCTVADPCHDGICVPGPGMPCPDDGLFCDGAEQCSGGTCYHAGNPCPSYLLCDETADRCVAPAGCTDPIPIAVGDTVAGVISEDDCFS